MSKIGYIMMCKLIPKYNFIASYRMQYKQKGRRTHYKIQKKYDKVYKSPKFIRNKDN